MIQKINRALKRWMRKHDAEVTIRSESYVEVLENALGRKLDTSSAADMGLLDEFVDMNKRLEQAPQYMRQRIRKLWYEAIKEMNMPAVPIGNELNDKIVISARDSEVN